ncbi:MAG: cysteine desulfurase [Spirulinaceae cyanobacterium RM2_2_10]|nr:cysteine desulfurase [Spirulinaceae cyanobacterium SM2_1_0]NJO20931.1 cysteine desulfurase [Spirulinaceae cyanobacterium RM2_2_10]
MQIYLDYSATTPTRPEAIARMQTILTEQWGNPSSLHSWGQQAAMVVEEARSQVAQLIGARDPGTLTFTASGTEANNLAIFGIAHQYTTPQHLIISSVEHSAVAEPVRWLAARGWQVSELPVNARGRVAPADLAAAMRPDTVLISTIYGQSEVGTLQPIRELAAIARSRGIPFHTDAVQVAGRLPLDVAALGVDLLSLSSHKLYGPQGAGALYVRSGLELEPLLQGGGQENRRRSGTQAVATLAGFGVAAERAAQELPAERQRLCELRDRLFALLADSPHLRPTGDRQQRLPHHVSFCLRSPQPGLTGRTLVRQLNLAGIGISAGSACHSGKPSPSPILKAMGYDDAQALSGIRLTLGRLTEPADVEWTALVLRQVLARLLPEPALIG